MVGGDTAFQVRNALIVNTAFSVNSTGIYFSNTLVSNATNFIGVANNALYLGGTLASGYQTTAGLSANVATLGANNASYLGGYLSTSYVNTTGTFSLSGPITLTANLILSGAGAQLSANGTVGTANQVLTSNGTTPYWGTPSADTTNATNISSGTLNAARLPLDYTNATNISTGTLSSSRLATNILFSNVASQSISGGANVISYSIGIVSSGTTTIDCGKCPLQYLTNNGAFTLAAPTSDGSCVILMTNGTGAGAVANSGFSISASVGDALTTTNGNKFMWYIVRINAISTFTIKALQ